MFSLFVYYCLMCLNNEWNYIKHGYSLMVRDARGAILNPGAAAQISKAGAEFMPPGAQYWSQGRNTGAQSLDFLTSMLAPCV